MEYTFEELSKIKQNPGIYCITNTVNNKRYVGQARKLRARLQQHYCTFKHGGNSRMILYAAMLKHGINNFVITVLCELDIPDSKKLDELEKQYIKELNSYGSSGYNQTAGGDGGVLGYKHTEESLQKLKKNSEEQYKKAHQDPTNWPKAKNWKTGEIVSAYCIPQLSKLIKVCESSISRCINGRQNNASGIWTFSYSNEFPTLNTSSNGVKGHRKISPDLIIEAYNKIKNARKLAQFLQIDPKTARKYIQELHLNDQVQRQII